MTIGDEALEGQIDFSRERARRGLRKRRVVADFDQTETSTMPERAGGWPLRLKLAILVVGAGGLWGLIALGLYALNSR